MPNLEAIGSNAIFFQFFLHIVPGGTIFGGLGDRVKQLKAHCEDHNFTHVYPQFTYTCMIFIYSYSYIFTIIGYKTNSQLTIYHVA